jgi:hypothetical protein
MEDLATSRLQIRMRDAVVSCVQLPQSQCSPGRGGKSSIYRYVTMLTNVTTTVLLTKKCAEKGNNK